ncbi:hypothetical protein FRC04_007211 [Tulasnella sp. 424]|nr:hypothetical protein FRC04_007211 [Tulasnella sp. 424]
MATATVKSYNLPQIPQKFGEDGGRFWKHYDDVADELDDDLVKRLKAQLDGLLIFAGLFAGVNSAFLTITLPMMSANPVDDTNALLLQLLRAEKGALQAANDLPSSSFSPAPAVYAVNVLFSISLTLALVSSFTAVLGQQWLVYYRKHEGGGPEYERWEHLRRHLGADRWKLEQILDDVLPSLLQLGVAIFCASFVLYLGILNRTIWIYIAVPVIAALTALFLTAIAAAWDKWCPFQSPLSHGIHHVLPVAAKFVRSVIVWSSLGVGGLISSVQSSIKILWTFCVMGRSWSWSREHVMESISNREPTVVRAARAAGEWIEDHMNRPHDDPSSPKFLALKRVICTSEDQRALDCAIANLRAVTDEQTLKRIVADDEMHDRLRHLALNSSLENSDTSTHRLRGTDILTYRRKSLYAGGYLHTILLGGSLIDFLSSRERGLSSNRDFGEIQNKLCHYVEYLWDQLFYEMRYPSSAGDTVIIDTLSCMIGILAVGPGLESSARRGRLLTHYNSYISSTLENNPPDKVIAIAACELLIRNELYHIDTARDVEAVRRWIKTSFVKLQGAYASGFTAAEAYITEAMQTVPADLLVSTGHLYCAVFCAAFEWERKNKHGFTKYLLLHFSSFIGDLLNSLDSPIRRREKHTAHRTLIESLVKHLRFVMETSTPTIEHDSALLELLRPFLETLNLPASVDPSGTARRSFDLFVRTFKEFEHWIWRGTRPQVPRRLTRDPDMQWCQFKQPHSTSGSRSEDQIEVLSVLESIQV